jgi:hypothetical protein
MHGDEKIQTQPGDGPIGGATASDVRRTAEAVGAILDLVHFGLYPESYFGDRQAFQGSQAQITAAAYGLKPLYFDPWGEAANELAAGLKAVLPPGTEVHALDGFLFVLRRAVLAPLVGERADRLLDAVLALSKSGENGLLLGYGAASTFHRPAIAVRIRDGQGNSVIGFNTTPALASESIQARLEDLIVTTGRTDFEVFVEELPS